MLVVDLLHILETAHLVMVNVCVIQNSENMENGTFHAKIKKGSV